MIKLLKILPWVFLLVILAATAWFSLGTVHQAFTVTVNGQEVHGAEKFFVGSAGLLAGAVVMVVGLIIAALALVGSGLLVFVILAFTALVFIALALPFLLPVAIPVIVVAFLIMISVKSNPQKSA